LIKLRERKKEETSIVEGSPRKKRGETLLRRPEKGDDPTVLKRKKRAE